MTQEFKFSAHSVAQLRTVHVDLRKVAVLALQKSAVDFKVLEGKRSLADQKKYVASGASKTMKSKHLTGNAIDVVPIINGKANWDEDNKLGAWKEISKAFKEAAKELNIKIVWGGDWKTFVDRPHFQLDV